MRNLIIGGIKHSGKTRLGRIIAHSRNMRFMDIDQVILRNHTEKTIRQLWLLHGESIFRNLEAQAVRKIAREIYHKTAGAVVALGGGTIENPSAMSFLSQLEGTRIYLKGNEEMLYKRIMVKGNPPFLSPKKPREDFSRLYERRNALYEQFADLICPVIDISPEENASKILEVLEKYNARK